MTNIVRRNPLPSAIAPFRGTHRRAITRFDVLILITTLSVLVALGSHPLGGPADISTVACLRNLHILGQTSALVAASDSRAILHRQSSAGFSNWRGLGRSDWGGTNGSDSFYGLNCSSPAACMSEATRPFNNFLSHEQILKLFHCPADTGAADIPGNYVPSPFEGPNTYLTSVFDACGNSYFGDFLWYPVGDVSMRFGSFMRPPGLVPKPAETLLFNDARFAQAFLSTTESIEADIASGQPHFVPSWHQPTNRHNVLFFDGHSQPVEVNVTGSMIPITTFPLDHYPYRTAMFRGPGWRYDALPEEFIAEYRIGDPLPRDASPPPHSASTPRTAPEHIPAD